MDIQTHNLDFLHDSLMTTAHATCLFVINVTYFKTILWDLNKKSGEY